MTSRIGSKHIAQHRGKAERIEIKRTNIAREAVKQARSKAKFTKQVKNQPSRALAAKDVLNRPKGN